MNGEARVTDDVAIVVASDLEQTRRNVSALGTAIRAAHLTAASPALARAVQAQENVYDRIDAEFGLLTSAQAADRMSSRAVARRNAPTSARGEGRLLALRRGKYLLYPAFQFGSTGIRPVIAELRAVGEQHGWDETSLIEWLVAPTTYLGGRRPVDIIDDAGELLTLATESFGVSW